MSDYLIHHGIKGQKWGVRRFQNADGTRTNAGKKHESENRAVLRGVRKAFDKSWSAYKETVKPGTLESTLVDSPAREKAIRILQDDENFQKALAPIVERAKAVQQKYKGKMPKDIDWNERSRELYDLDRAVGELSVKAGIVKSNGPGDPEEFDRWAYIGFVAARELDEVTGDPGIGDALIHGGTKIKMNTEHNYLIHWLKKGEKAKYIDKVKLPNGRWRYFYTQAQLDAYKKSGGQLSKSADSLADKAKQGLRGLKEGALNTGARAIVGVANRNEAISSRLGGSYKHLANNRRDVATRLQNEANGLNRQAQQERAYGASQAREGRVEGVGAKLRYAVSKDERDYVKQARRNAIESQVHAENDEREAKGVSARASKARTEGAEYQKKYDNSILGRAEKRVKTDDIRKAQQARQPKQPAKKSGESIGSRASKALSNAKEAVADRAAEAVVGAANRNSTVRSLIGGQRQDKARSYGNAATDEQNYADMLSRKAATSRAEGASLRRRGRTSGADDSRRMAEAYEYTANGSNERASTLRSAAAREQKAYEQSLLGRAQARVNRKGKKKSSSKKKSNRLNLSGGNYAVFQDAKIGR